MNLREISRLLSGFTLFFSLAPLVPLTYELTAGGGSIWPFIGAMAAGALTSLILWLLGRTTNHAMFRREGLTVVSLAWLVAGLLAAVPFMVSGAIPGFVDAFFESVSGLTTTGATVLGTGNPDIESLPRSILLWRSMIQWMGGIGVVLVFIVLLPAMGVTGSKLLRSEEIGVATSAERPQIRKQARQLFALYVGLTICAAIAYWATGMQVFDAACHALTTLATGGFSTKNASIGAFQNIGVEIASILMMFLAGCNFLFLIRFATGRSRRGRPIDLIRGIEFKVYVGLTLTLTLAVTITLWNWGAPLPDEALGITRDYSSLGRCLRDAAFQVTSLLTSTGFATADFEKWPKPALYVLVACMFIGGSTGSTAGGFKVLRVVVCAQLIRHALHHFIRPRVVEKVKVGPEVIPNSVVSALLAMLLLWIVATAAGTLVLDLDPRLDLVSSFTASLSMMGCVGPSISEVISGTDGAFQLVGSVDLGPYSGYGELQPLAKVFLALQMILGRLEILAPLILLVPTFWRR